MKSNRFSWYSLGGLGEVGMNCMILDFGGQVVPVDAGILFANSNDFGIESLHPDFTSILKEKSPAVWLITHGHEDHIGAVPFVLKKALDLGLDPPEIWAPPLSASLILEKLKDHVFPKGQREVAVQKIKSIQMSEWLNLGADLRVMWIPNRHSTPQSGALAFEWTTGGKTFRLFHSSDFKLDENAFEDGTWSEKRYRVFSNDADPDLMLVDSTNAEREGHSVSEIEILPGLERILGKAKARVYVGLFSSNLYRIGALMKIGQKLNRQVCLAGRSINTAWAAAQNLNLIGNEIPDVKHIHLVDVEQINDLPPEKQFIICTGSQGEHRSVLSRIMQGSHGSLAAEPGDTVVLSSKIIPGNDKAVSRIINGLIRRGVEVVWSEMARSLLGGPIHASGHGRRQEIERLLKILKPKKVLPVHGELRQLKSCKDLALQVGQSWGLKETNVFLVENGQKLIFGVGESGWEFQSSLDLDLPPRVLNFGNFLTSAGEDFLKIRKQAALGGVISGFLDSAGRCRVEVKGVLPKTVKFDLEEIESWLEGQYRSLKSQRAFERYEPELEMGLSDEMSRFVKRQTGLRPVCFVHLVTL